jgi:hypothetical protein
MKLSISIIPKHSTIGPLEDEWDASNHDISVDFWLEVGNGI